MKLFENGHNFEKNVRKLSIDPSLQKRYALVQIIMVIFALLFVIGFGTALTSFKITMTVIFAVLVSIIILFVAMCIILYPIVLGICIYTQGFRSGIKEMGLRSYISFCMNATKDMFAEH